jgi:hypothetical protein
MNVITSVEQGLFPFDFYTDSRNKHPLILILNTNIYVIRLLWRLTQKNIAKLEPVIETI